MSKRAAITGHQQIGDQDAIDWVTEELANLITEYGISYGFTALAVGADQIFATCLAASSVPYTAVMPCSRYEETFQTKSDLERFRSLREKAAEEITLNFQSPSEDAFYEAGLYVIDKSDIVFAVWNGKATAGRGGTGDAVEYAMNSKKTVVHISNVNRTVEVLSWQNECS